MKKKKEEIYYCNTSFEQIFSDNEKSQEQKESEALYKVKEAFGSNTGDKFTIRKTPNRVKLPANVMVFQKFALSVACCQELTAGSLRLLICLMGILRYENIFTSLDYQNIEKITGIDKRTIQRAFKQLQQFNICVSIPNTFDKRSKDWAINPIAMWKGNGNARMQKMKLMKKEDTNIPIMNKQQLELPLYYNDFNTNTNTSKQQKSDI